MALPQSLPLTLSYFGETLVHPGVYAGSEISIHENFLASLSIGTYLHYRHHRGAFVNADFSWRKTFSIGYSMEFGAGLGYLHTWSHGGTIYTVTDAGVVEEKPNYGFSSLMPKLNLNLLGWDFRKSHDIPFRAFSGIVLFGQYPYNQFMMPHFALQLGGTYYLNLNKENDHEK
ncbi:MAG: hypothetical protein OEZ22_09945 [Spirochaetia bacterium]|nr:hypothetical protein [Spirochaetia bacterium]